MALAQSVQLELDGEGAALRVIRLRGVERLCAPYAFEVSFSPARDAGPWPGGALSDLVGKPARISMALPDGAARLIDGIVDAISASAAAYVATVVPKVSLLSDMVDYLVFLDREAVEIAKQVLSEHGITADARVARALAKRPQCVAAFETRLGFLSRILAEEGIAWYLPVDRKDVLVLADAKGAFDATPGVDALPVRELAAAETAESVQRVTLRRAMVPDRLTLRDYNFGQPTVDMTAAAGDGPGQRERYEHPGGYPEPGLGRALAQIRLEEAQARQLVLTGVTSSRRLAPGHTIALEGSALDAVNAKWLVLEVAHELVDQSGGDAVDGEVRYEARFTAVPADREHRPARRRAPRARGLETATVTAPAGSEIHTDRHGRAKIHLRWDRRRPVDDTSSTWTRVLQPPTSGGLMQPRTGWEVLTSFHAASADDPLVLGRMYNGAAVPARPLPGGKTGTVFGSLTTPGGGSANVIAMDDTAGNELMSFTASKDFNERTENDKATEITGDDTWSVGANRTAIVGKACQVAVTGAQSYTVAANRTVNLEANALVEAASESVLVGGLRVFNVGGDYSQSSASLARLVGAAKVETAVVHQTRHVTGPSTVLVGGSWNEHGVVDAAVKVGGASTEIISGSKKIDAGTYGLTVRGALSETLASRKIKAGGGISEEYTGPYVLSVGASAKLRGSDVTVEATASLTIKASGITVKMTPGSITIDGKFDGKVKSVDDGDESYDG
ncbi:type VI secretion system Vgr family protein [Sorangium sp. So ce385]|uniref:type VI secretion system Vgr family protein n=1 Tax=Sorangium sp. So ce385 TaxID=3133308 RepID=UPI003F5C83A1